MNHQYISIEGNIGAGKTTLAERLAREFNAMLLTERFEDNSFLPKFYKDPESYAFALELSFLADRYQQIREHVANRNLFHSCVVSDYFFDKSGIFAGVNLKDPERRLYRQLFDIIRQNLPEPDLIVYLHASPEILLNRIRERGRGYEKHIPAGYLISLQEMYVEYFRQKDRQRVLWIDIEKKDPLHPDHYGNLINLLEKGLPPGIHYF